MKPDKLPHEKIWQIYCRECPILLEEALFDGLLWHSKDVENSKIRVNYYISEMYGDTTKEPNVWKHPLAVLVGKGSSEMFEHPVCIYRYMHIFCATYI